MTLTEFLLASIAGDEAAARKASTGQHWTWTDDGEDLMSEHTYPIGTVTGRECIIATEGANPPEADKAGAHIARHDPAHVLAVCAAHRKIVELHSGGVSADPVCRHLADEPCDTLRALATIYADRDGYREEWRA